MDEIFDEGLMEIMGERYDGGDDPVQMPVMERKEAPKKVEAVKPTHTERSAMARLCDMTKWVGICGSISMLMWWFLTNDLMAMEAAYPCIVGCALLAGFGVGKNVVSR